MPWLRAFPMPATDPRPVSVHDLPQLHFPPLGDEAARWISRLVNGYNRMRRKDHFNAPFTGCCVAAVNALVSLARKGIYNPKVRFLAGYINRNPGTVRNAIKAMECYRIIRVHPMRRGGGQAENCYEFICLPPALRQGGPNAGRVVLDPDPEPPLAPDVTGVEPDQFDGKRFEIGPENSGDNWAEIEIVPEQAGFIFCGGVNSIEVSMPTALSTTSGLSETVDESEPEVSPGAVAVARQGRRDKYGKLPGMDRTPVWAYREMAGSRAQDEGSAAPGTALVPTETEFGIRPPAERAMALYGPLSSCQTALYAEQALALLPLYRDEETKAGLLAVLAAGDTITRTPAELAARALLLPDQLAAILALRHDMLPTVAEHEAQAYLADFPLDQSEMVMAVLDCEDVSAAWRDELGMHPYEHPDDDPKLDPDGEYDPGEADPRLGGGWDP